MSKRERIYRKEWHPTLTHSFNFKYLFIFFFLREMKKERIEKQQQRAGNPKLPHPPTKQRWRVNRLHASCRFTTACYMVAVPQTQKKNVNKYIQIDTEQKKKTYSLHNWRVLSSALGFLTNCRVGRVWREETHPLISFEAFCIR